MYKIVGICGSPRKKAAYKALSAALESAQETGDIEIELIELRGRKINFCIHCNKCLRDDAAECTVFTDDMTELYDKIYGADGILIASPVYEMNVTAQLAAFFNRFRPTWNIIKNNPDFFSNKVGAALAVGGTRNGGQEMTINAIHGFYHTQGLVICSGGPGVYAGSALWNPGDGCGEMEDPLGMENARIIGRRLANLTKKVAAK